MGAACAFCQDSVYIQDTLDHECFTVIHYKKVHQLGVFVFPL